MTTKCQHKVKRIDSRLQAMLQILFNKTGDEKLNFVESEDCLFQKGEKITTSRRHVKNITDILLDNQDLFAPLASIIKKETEKSGYRVGEGRSALKIRGDPHTTSALSATSSYQSPTGIFGEQTNNEAY